MPQKTVPAILDDATLSKTLSDIWPLLEPGLPKIIDHFYTHALNDGAMASFFEGSDINELKAKQFDHWQKTFTQGFGKEFKDRVKKIGEMHQRRGVTPAIMLQGHAIIMQEMTNAIYATKKLKKNREIAVKAVQQLFIREIDGIITYYISYMNWKADERVAEAVRRFEFEMGSNVDSIASAIEQLERSIDDISGQVRAGEQQTAGAAGQTRSAADEVQALNRQADKIGEVSQFIKEIAEQTNLLALNASIEAARAGEAGRGFAVVAEEVKKLAASTEQATQEIGTQIAEIQAATTGVATAMEAITQEMSDLQVKIGSVTSAMSEQQTATADIASNVGGITERVRQIGTHLIQDQQQEKLSR
jgi:methyl-accepting chemotaxis protein